MKLHSGEIDEAKSTNKYNIDEHQVVFGCCSFKKIIIDSKNLLLPIFRMQRKIESYTISRTTPNNGGNIEISHQQP